MFGICEAYGPVLGNDFDARKEARAVRLGKTSSDDRTSSVVNTIVNTISLLVSSGARPSLPYINTSVCVRAMNHKASIPRMDGWRSLLTDDSQDVVPGQGETFSPSSLSRLLDVQTDTRFPVDRALHFSQANSQFCWWRKSQEC